jgi:hypothetical protein
MAWIFGIYFIGNMISNSMMNTGAFEVALNGIIFLRDFRRALFSKLFFFIISMGVNRQGNLSGQSLPQDGSLTGPS